MSTVKIDWQLESDDLALAKDMVKSILGDWDWISWNELLAFDVVLSLRMTPVWGDDPQTVDGVLRVVGREDAERLLGRIRCDFARKYNSAVDKGRRVRKSVAHRYLYGLQLRGRDPRHDNCSYRSGRSD
jgi:hypothetical protein